MSDLFLRQVLRVMIVAVCAAVGAAVVAGAVLVGRVR